MHLNFELMYNVSSNTCLLSFLIENVMQYNLISVPLPQSLPDHMYLPSYPIPCPFYLSLEKNKGFKQTRIFKMKKKVYETHMCFYMPDKFDFSRFIIIRNESSRLLLFWIFFTTIPLI